MPEPDLHEQYPQAGLDDSLWQDATWIILDTETTGLDEKGEREHRMVELGCAVMRHGETINKVRRVRMDPGRPIDPGATKTHGISDEDVAGRKTWADLYIPFFNFLKKFENKPAIIMGYNVLRYDVDIIRRSCEDVDPLVAQDWDMMLSRFPVVDVFGMVVEEGRYWKGKGRHRLANVARRLKIPALKGPDGKSAPMHRATTDCYYTGRVAWAFRNHARFQCSTNELAEWTKKWVDEHDRRMREFFERKATGQQGAP